jgi:hypothetical protein
MSEFGTKRTNPTNLAMSANHGRPEVKNERSNQEPDQFSRNPAHEPSALDLFGEEKAAQIVDNIERFADVFRDFRAALCATK